jgi:hypothetical protein
MKRIAAAVAVFVLVVAALPPAIAQSQAPGAAGDAKDMAPQPEPVKPVTSARQRSRSTADARHCLQFTTIVQIIKCAEKYR